MGQDADEPIFRFGGRAFLDEALLNALDELEGEAVQDVIAQHQLPPTNDPSQVSLVLRYGRSDVRSRLFGKVLEIAKTDPADRTENQQLIADAFTDKLQEQRIAAVEFAINEYGSWESSPCHYVPPEPFTYDPDPNGTLCDGSFTLSDLLTMVQPPTLEEFLAYGAVDARKSLLGEEGAIVVAETQGSMIGYSALIAAGIAIVGAAALGALVFFGGQSLFLVGVGGAIAAGTTATAFSAVVASALGAIGIALVGIFIGVMQGIFVFTAAAIPDQLAEALVQAQQERPLLHEVVATAEGVQELFYTFIPTTLPEFRSTEPAPELTNLDQCFEITDQVGNKTITDTISYLPWPVHPDDTIDDVARWTTGLSEGWFVSEAVLDDQTINTRGLVIQFISWDPDGLSKPMGAWRMGDQFLLVAQSGDPQAGVISDELRFISIDENNKLSLLVARIADVDCSPPDISVSVDGELGNNGWYVSDVFVDWDLVDLESDIFQESGCEDTDIISDGMIDLVCIAESGGGFSELGVTVKRDTTSPTIIVESVDPPANAAGWNNEPVTIKFDCHDETSGIDDSGFINLGFTFLGEGMNLSHIGRCSDRAGNESSTTVSGINIDRTLPTIESSAPPAPNAAGWHNTNVTISFTCDDALSSIASCTGDAVLGEGTNQTQTGTAIDKADNINSTTVGPFNIDTTPPTISGITIGPANEAGWHNNDLIVQFSCSDYGPSGRDFSAIGDGCGPSLAINAETPGRDITGTATDIAGNTSTKTIHVKLDKTAPTISGSTSPAPNAAGWHNTNVTVSFTCGDALSGIASCTAPAILGEGTNQSRGGTAFDIAGNSNSTTVNGISVDKTPPVVTLTTPLDGVEYLLHQVIYADWGGAADSLSGLASSIGTVPSGQAIDTATAGEKSFEVKAIDVAGNETIIRHMYNVLSPAESIDNLVDDIKALVVEDVLKPNQAKGIKEPLDNALRSLARNQIEPACSQLDDFIAEVDAKTPRPLDTETAAALIAAAQDIVTISLDCP